jgi:glyoxylase-like metal-dependent hydrolase (beta-lactamase superfamily II)
MSIRIMSCASMSPWWPRWHIGGSVLLIDTDQGPVLIDTGLGLHDHLDPGKLVKFYRMDFGIHSAPDETAIRSVKKLGIQPETIRNIALTHGHFDHAGGLPDFPWADIHIHQRELESIRSPRTWIERFAYDPKDFSHQVRWKSYHEIDSKWFEYDAIRLPFEPEMYLIPLFGHTSGHCGVAVRDGSGWHFHCGDALPVSAGFDLTPPVINRIVIGSHVDPLRSFSREHPDIRLTAGHHWLEFDKHLSGGNHASRE